MPSQHLHLNSAFGVAFQSDHESSDLDILIDPTPETKMFDIGAIRHELLQMLVVLDDGRAAIAAQAASNTIERAART